MRFIWLGISIKHLFEFAQQEQVNNTTFSSYVNKLIYS